MSRERGEGCATGQPQGIGSEAYLNSTSQGPIPEDARKDAHIRGRSRQFVKYPGKVHLCQFTLPLARDSPQTQSPHSDHLSCENHYTPSMTAITIMEHDLHAMILSRQKTLARGGVIGGSAFLNCFGKKLCDRLHHLERWRVKGKHSSMVTAGFI